MNADDEEEETDDFGPIADFEDAREDLHHDPEPAADAESHHEAEVIAHKQVGDASDLTEELSEGPAQEIKDLANSNVIVSSSSESVHGETDSAVDDTEERKKSPLEVGNGIEESTEEASAVGEVADVSSADAGDGEGSPHSFDSESGKPSSTGEHPVGANAVEDYSSKDSSGATSSDLDQIAISDEQEVRPVAHEQPGTAPIVTLPFDL